MNQNFKNVRSFILVDPSGMVRSFTQRSNNKRPARSVGNGNWIEIPTNYCCSEPSFILFRNTTASADITSISTADGSIDWSGTIANGDYYIFNLPNSYNQTFTIVTSTFASRTLTNTTEQGDGVISTIGALSSVTNTFTTSATQGSQYLVLLS